MNHCEGCTAHTVEDITPDMMEKVQFVQVRMRKELKRRVTIPEAIRWMLREYPMEKIFSEKVSH